MATLTPAEAAASITTTHSLFPKPDWLTLTLTTIPPSPKPAQLKTLLFRLLSQPISTTLQPASNTCFPATIHDPTSIGKSQILAGPIACQVIAIEDIGSSKFDQLERLEMKARGEAKRGNQVIQITAEGDDVVALKPWEQAARAGPHKLLLEDAVGRRVWAFENGPVDGVGLEMNLGCKMVLQTVLVLRGVVMIDSGCARVLGGKVEELNKAWEGDGKRAWLQRMIDEEKAARDRVERGGR
ncbi:hypothetical protein BJ508DRAFT_206240 [Ascobolus immersus RN42]|uniref:RecQ-mediated genome instability protein 1 n=1 Tax=Ascobolus immersus RN42 TaxID=1160509 RepID=A0A3N4IJK3_ASCIM|nr:hypothetical protein BJ508DRAFT_206240 [Ascobolus immersus RN42]